MRRYPLQPGLNQIEAQLKFFAPGAGQVKIESWFHQE